MKYYFITVNYNGSNFTRKYVDSVSKLKMKSRDYVEIVIVDNDSSLEEKKELDSIKNDYHNVRVIWSTTNIGYFKGLNKGIENVQKTEQTILIIGNNDLTFDGIFLENLSIIEYSNNTLIIAPNIITEQGRYQNPHVLKDVSKIEKIKTAIYYSNYYVGQLFRMVNQLIKKIRNKPNTANINFPRMEIKRGIGACYILTNNFFKYFDKLDDRVFMWGEEALLSNQIESVGGVTLFDPSIKIIHHESASVKNIQPKKKYYMVKESYKIYKKYL